MNDLNALLRGGPLGGRILVVASDRREWRVQMRPANLHWTDYAKTAEEFFDKPIPVETHLYRRESSAWERNANFWYVGQS